MTAIGVDLQDLQLDSLTLQGAQVLHTAHGSVGSGNEHADTVGDHQNATLDHLGDGTIQDGALSLGIHNDLPALQSVDALLGQHDGAFLIVGAHDEQQQLVANLHQIVGIGGGIVGQLIDRNIAGLLAADDFDLNLVGRNAYDQTADFIISRVLQSSVDSGGKLLRAHLLIVLGIQGFVVNDFGHSCVYLLYNIGWSGCSGGQTDRHTGRKAVTGQLVRCLDPEGGAVNGAHVTQFGGIGTLSSADNNHLIALLGQRDSLLLPFSSSSAYCIKYFYVCTEFFCDFFTLFPCVFVKSGLCHHNARKSVPVVTGQN